MKWREFWIIMVLVTVLILQTCIWNAKCKAKDEYDIWKDSSLTTTIDSIFTYTAIEISHYKSDIKWVIPDFNDLRECTDEELCNITIAVTLGNCGRDVNDYFWFYNKLIPERFKVGVDPNG